MPDVQRTVARWLRLGRLLPREVRERVFEPAFYDVVRTWLQSGPGSRGIPFGARALWTALRCGPIALPRAFFNHGRLTKLSRIAIGIAAVGTSVLLALLVALRPYLGYGN